MPKARGARGRRVNADDNVVEIAQNLEQLLPDQPTHPRTRAWVKQEKSKAEKTVVTPASVIDQSLPRRSGRQRGLVSESRSLVPSQARNQRSKTTASINANKSRPPVTRIASANKPSTSRQQRSAITPALLQERKEPGARRGDNNHSTRRKTKAASAKQNQKERRQTELVLSRKPEEVRRRARPQTPTLVAWLSEVEPATPGSGRQEQAPYTPSDAGSAQSLEDEMDYSSTTRTTGDGESTVRETGRKPVKLSDEKLRYRRVSRKATTDGKLEHIKSILKTQLPERPLHDIKVLEAAAQHFLQQIADHPNASCYSYIDDFSYEFDKGKSKICYPVINHTYFEGDLRRCLASNEAVLQRTIMIHIINHYWLGKIFDWNVEGQWSLDKNSRLPSREDDSVSMPKPDLAVSFTLESFTGDYDDSDPIPRNLEKCLSPDGGGRCFPFLFLEAKKAGSDLLEAYLANLHSASQALYNMYSWMVLAGQEQKDSFFEDVRVFSLVFNAQDLGVRVHRAEEMRDKPGVLLFHFDELLPLARYTKDQACLLIQAILKDYAEKELHPALEKAFRAVINLEDERVQNKRKADAGSSSLPKKARGNQNTAQNTAQNTVQSTGQSFGMSQLAT